MIRSGLVAGGWYAASLKRYRQLFGDQLLVLLHDDVTADPGRVYRRALVHIGADLDFVPTDLESVLFSNQRPRGSGSTDEAASCPRKSDNVPSPTSVPTSRNSSR